MVNDKFSSILKGMVQIAVYKEQELEEYKNNPYIEALPNIFTEDEIIDAISYVPDISNKDKEKERSIRYHIIKRIKNYVQPLPIYFTIERRLSTLIRRAYISRNPINKNSLQIISKINTLAKNKNLVLDDLCNCNINRVSTADSMSIIGISGIGKTTAIEKLLLMYPQVIIHKEYKGNKFTRTQIVWLKIDCPNDGNLSTLCKSFFKAIDDILGTRYLDKFGYKNRIASEMMINMTSLSSMFGIGVLVIDEIQNLMNNKEIYPMLDFFVTLSNTVNMPTVFIGTSKAQKLFESNFRQARRMESNGIILWDRMNKESDEWNFFLESLWEFNCLKKDTKLSNIIKNTLYDECQGITSILVSLFVLAQERALSEGEEKLTVKIIRETAKNDLAMIQPMIKALRSNNKANILKYEDISLELDNDEYSQSIDMAEKLKTFYENMQHALDSNKNNTIQRLANEMKLMGLFKNLDYIEIKNECFKVVNREGIKNDYDLLKKKVLKSLLELDDDKVKNNNYNNSNINSNNLGKLLELYSAAQKEGIHPYEKLKENGYIKNPIEEFLENQ